MKHEDIFNQIMSTRQASELWGLSQGTVKRLARERKIIARKLDEEDRKSPYLILKEQSNPTKEKFNKGRINEENLQKTFDL